MECWFCEYMFVCWCNLYDTNINVSNVIKLSHFEVKDSCETKCDALSNIVKVLIYVNHTLNAIKEIWYFNNALVRTSYDASMSLEKNKWDSVSQCEYAKIIESTMFW